MTEEQYSSSFIGLELPPDHAQYEYWQQWNLDCCQGGGYNETSERSLVVAVNKSPSGLPLLWVKFCGVYFTSLSVIQRTRRRIVGGLPNDLERTMP
jgi:hypothetical protein